MTFFKDRPEVCKAIYLGTLCSSSYLGLYLARNMLSAVSPQLIDSGTFNKEQIGSLSSVYFIAYACGQLINGLIGDKIKAKYMMSLGMLLAGLSCIVFTLFSASWMVAYLAYGACGFFLSMIYGPMTKVVAENTKPLYATRCSLGYTFASFFGSPLAGVLAAYMVWQNAMHVSSAVLIIMSITAFSLFLLFEKKGVVKYHQFDRPKGQKGSIKLLIEHHIIKFTLISIITGIVRTTVVFWLPTYIADHLGFAPDTASLLFTLATLVISLNSFVSIFVYEKLRQNMEITIRLFFALAALFFLGTYVFKDPAVNIACIVLAIFSADAAATMLWSRYCPSLIDTGMVSSATGFLDFVSYMSASISSTVFANSLSTIGWNGLILIWFGLMAFGLIICLPFKKGESHHA